MLTKNSLIFANSDPYKVSDYVNQYIGAHGISAPNKRALEANLFHRRFGDLDFCRISYGSTVRVRSSGLSTCYHLQVLLNGSCLWRGYGEEYLFSPGELMVINPADQADLTYSVECEKLIVKIPINSLERICTDSHWKMPIGGVRFGYRYNLHQLTDFGILLHLACRESEGIRGSSRLSGYFSGIIINKMLESLDSNACFQILEGSGSPFERVVHFVDENIKMNISLDQMAAVARTSHRTLFNLFEKNSSDTPKNYVRKRKLEHIHRLLSDPSREVRSITEIALDYGFFHLGRFADSYRSLFGELPSDTLRKRLK